MIGHLRPRCKLRRRDHDGQEHTSILVRYFHSNVPDHRGVRGRQRQHRFLRSAAPSELGGRCFPKSRRIAIRSERHRPDPSGLVVATPVAVGKRATQYVSYNSGPSLLTSAESPAVRARVVARLRHTSSSNPSATPSCWQWPYYGPTGHGLSKVAVWLTSCTSTFFGGIVGIHQICESVHSPHQPVPTGDDDECDSRFDQYGINDLLSGHPTTVIHGTAQTITSANPLPRPAQRSRAAPLRARSRRRRRMELSTRPCSHTPATARMPARPRRDRREWQWKRKHFRRRQQAVDRHRRHLKQHPNSSG